MYTHVRARVCALYRIFLFLEVLLYIGLNLKIPYFKNAIKD